MKKQGKNAVVIKNHQSDNSEPLIVKTGELIEGQEKKTEWEGWLWCRTQRGLAGWMPKNYLQKQPDKPGCYSALRDYNARELTIHIGQSVFILDEENGWALVKTASQEEGWIPLRNLFF
jgi:hypothetical protein